MLPHLGKGNSPSDILGSLRVIDSTDISSISLFLLLTLFGLFTLARWLEQSLFLQEVLDAYLDVPLSELGRVAAQ